MHLFMYNIWLDLPPPVVICIAWYWWTTDPKAVADCWKQRRTRFVESSEYVAIFFFPGLDAVSPFDNLHTFLLDLEFRFAI